MSERLPEIGPSTRVPHIAALDDALELHMRRLIDAEQRQVEVLAAHKEFLARHAEEVRKVEEATKARQTAYCAAKACEDAIRKFGFVVLGVRGKDASRLDGHPGDFRRPISPPGATP